MTQPRECPDPDEHSRRPLNVALLSQALPESYRGGLQVHVWQLARHLAARGHRITVITAANPLRAHVPFKRDGVRIIPVPYFPVRVGGLRFLGVASATFNRSVVHVIRRLERQEEVFDVVHGHGVDGYRYAASRRPRSCYVATVHATIRSELDDVLEELPFLRRVEQGRFRRFAIAAERIQVGHADQLITVSRQTARCMASELGVDRDEITIIPNGVEVERFGSVPRARVRGRVLCIARLDPRKGLRFLVDAAADLKDRFPHLSVHIVGQGDERQRLEQRIRELDVQSTVVLRGSLEGPAFRREFSEASVFALPSLSEGQGIVFLEAMASRLPVVGFRIGGVDEMIDDGEQGFLVETGSLSGLSTALERLLSNEPLARAMGRKGHRRVVERYRWDGIADRTARLYRAVLASAGRARGGARPQVAGSG